MVQSQSSKQKERSFHEKQRARGLRLVQFWVPDVNSPEFKAEAHRQSLAVANSEHAAEDQAFVDSISVDLFSDEL